MNYVSIEDLITDKISGEWGTEPSDGNSVVVIRTANFKNTGKIDFSKIVRREIDEHKITKKRLDVGDVIIEKSGGSPTQPVGRVVLFEKPDDDIYLCNNFTSILRPNKKLVFPAYLFYALHNNHKLGRTLRFQNKTTGIINLKLDKYLKSKIPLPPLDDQICMAYLLGKVEGLIAQRKENLQQLDELLKSVFLKMFGDPVRNENRWEKDTVGKSIKIQGGFAFKSKDLLTRGKIRLVKISNVHFENLIWDDISYVPDNYYKEYNKFVLNEGDILIALTRPVIKSLDVVKTATICTEDLPCLLNQRVGRFVFDSKTVNKNFFLHYCYTPYFKSMVDKLCPPGLQPNISTNQIESIPLYYPPINLQNQFAATVKKVESIKSRYQNSLTELETLYSVLSQKAFRGELDLSRVPLPQSPAPSQHEETNLPEQNQENYTRAEEQAEILNADLNQIEQLDRPAMSTAQGRAKLLGSLFETYIKELHNGAPLSLDDFWQNVQLKTLDYVDEDSEPLGLADYDQVKKYLFRLLGTGEVIQTFNEDKNRIELQARG